MDTLPVFIVLHSVWINESGELDTGESLCINPTYISGMFPAEVRLEDTTKPCTTVAVIGVESPINVIESPQDICDLILAANGMSRPSDPGEARLFLPYEEAVRDENPWESR